MLRFGAQFEISSLRPFAKRELLSSWWENDGQSVDFGSCVGSIPYMYEPLPPRLNDGIKKVREELCCMFEVPQSRMHLAIVHRFARIYTLFRRDALAKTGVDLVTIFA